MGGKRGISNGRKGKSPGPNRPGEEIYGHLRLCIELYQFLDGRPVAVEVTLPWRGKDWLSRDVCLGVCSETWRSHFPDHDDGNRRGSCEYAYAGNLVGGQE